MRSSPTTRKCGTCDFWTGKRDIVHNQYGDIKVEIIDESGDCENCNSNFFEQQREQRLSCIKYSRWTEAL